MDTTTRGCVSAEDGGWSHTRSDERYLVYVHMQNRYACTYYTLFTLWL